MFLKINQFKICLIIVVSFKTALTSMRNLIHIYSESKGKCVSQEAEQLDHGSEFYMATIYINFLLVLMVTLLTSLNDSL